MITKRKAAVGRSVHRKGHYQLSFSQPKHRVDARCMPRLASSLTFAVSRERIRRMVNALMLTLASILIIFEKQGRKILLKIIAHEGTKCSYIKVVGRGSFRDSERAQHEEEEIHRSILCLGSE